MDSISLSEQDDLSRFAFALSQGFVSSLSLRLGSALSLAIAEVRVRIGEKEGGHNDLASPTLGVPQLFPQIEQSQLSQNHPSAHGQDAFLQALSLVDIPIRCAL
jgi:hypothetical protein